MRREQDTINPRSHPDIMTLSNGDPDNPFWYARVIDIFHADVRYTGLGATPATAKWRRVEFLWVRWFELVPDYDSGFAERRMPRVSFTDADDPHSVAFSFIDPGDVLRAAYIIPVFVHGTTDALLGPSELARRPADEDEDYAFYDVCMYVYILCYVVCTNCLYRFADRDLYMRHLGGGVGHRGVGVDVYASRAHSLRTSPPGYPSDHAPSPGEDDMDVDADPPTPSADRAHHEARERSLEDEAFEDDMDDEDDNFDEPDTKEDGWWWDGEDDEEMDEFFGRDEVFGVQDADGGVLSRGEGWDGDEMDAYGMEGFARL